MGALIHPRFFEHLHALFPDRITFQRRSATTQDPYGEPVDTWSDILGYVNLPCAQAPLSAEERQALQMTVSERVWTILIPRYLPDITSADRAVLGGVAYDIISVESDQTHTLTRVRLREVQP